MGDAAGWILACVVFPLWVAAGLADWACHRATRIEATSGLPENVLHWLMFAEVGAGCMAACVLEVNAAVLVLVLVLFLAHEATVAIDLRWTVPVRRVGIAEQMVHSFQEIFPLAALLLLATLAWDQALAVLGLGGAAPDWGLRWKSQPLPLAFFLGGGALVALFNALPLAQETLACLRARR